MNTINLELLNYILNEKGNLKKEEELPNILNSIYNISDEELYYMYNKLVDMLYKRYKDNKYYYVFDDITIESEDFKIHTNSLIVTPYLHPDDDRYEACDYFYLDAMVCVLQEQNTINIDNKDYNKFYKDKMNYNQFSNLISKLNSYILYKFKF